MPEVKPCGDPLRRPHLASSPEVASAAPALRAMPAQPVLAARAEGPGVGGARSGRGQEWMHRYTTLVIGLNCSGAELFWRYAVYEATNGHPPARSSSREPPSSRQIERAVRPPSHRSFFSAVRAGGLGLALARVSPPQ